MLFILVNWKWLLGAAATGVLAILLGVTTIDRNQWRAAARTADATIAKFTVAQDTAQKAAQAAHDAQESRYKELANASQATQESRAKPASDATTSYADAHRVREQAASCPSSPAVAGTPRVDPGVPASLPADTLVAISDVDLHKCAALGVYGVSAHDWAAGLNTSLPLPDSSH